MIFKLYERFRIHIFQAIVINYVVACTCGMLLYEGSISIAALPQYGWFYYTIGLGILFIIVFNLMALTTQRSGLSVVSVATKMSVVIPILFGLFYYKEDAGIFKIFGIVLALLAVYLVSLRSAPGLSVNKQNLVFPLLVFLGGGVIDVSIKFLEESFVAENAVPLFSATIFGAAASVGILVLLAQAFMGTLQLRWKNILGGIALGVPNYFSIFFLVKALRSGILDSSGIFTVNNVAIVMLSTFVGILIFTERLRFKNWLGIVLAVISIFLMAVANL